MTSATLRWVERGLLAVGIVLALWCAMVMIDAYRVSRMPVPPPPPLSAEATNAPPSSPPRTYKTLPLPGAWVARLDAPTVKLSATVLEGSDDDTLRRGAGHIEDTPFPGEPGNVGIAGHRDTVFRAVRRLRIGDPLDVTTADRLFHYRIAKTSIVKPEDVYVLDAGDHPTLTLVTCYPFEFLGHAPRRFIISADLLGEEPRTVSSAHP